jgi:hypothetical protein
MAGPIGREDPADKLGQLLRAETTQPLAAPIAAIVEAVRRRHGASAAAVLFYGSCLRRGNDQEGIVDLYLLVESYRAAYGPGLGALLNWALPPNVFYLEVPFNGRTVRAKYAVISIADFEAGASGRWFHPYLWARFAQPCRLAYCRDPAIEERVEGALAAAIGKAVREGLDLVGDCFTSADLWVSLFRATYRTELRPEPPERAAEIHKANEERYARAVAAVLPGLGVEAVAVSGHGTAGWQAPRGRRSGVGRKWLLRRLQGKLLSVARLVKAAFTFHDGLHYLLWKIARHSGVTITLTAWQRRHPVLAAPALLWRLYRKGAFR